MGCTSVKCSLSYFQKFLPEICIVSLPIRVSGLQKYQCLHLQQGTLDRMGNSQRSDCSRNSDSSSAKVSHLYFCFFSDSCPSTALELYQMF